MDQRWEKAGSRVQRLPGLSAFPPSCASPPGKKDAFAGRESRLFRKRGGALQLQSAGPGRRWGGFRGCPSSHTQGTTALIPVRRGTARKPATHLFPTPGGRLTVSLCGAGPGSVAEVVLSHACLFSPGVWMWSRWDVAVKPPGTGYPARLCRLCPELGRPDEAVAGLIASPCSPPSADASCFAAASMRRR